MNNKRKKELIKLLQSGNFTIAYHDNGECCLYDKKIKNIDRLIDNEEKSIESFSDCDSDGYLSIIVELLVEALGGKSLTI
jgi:hypothetical protein